MTDDIRSCRHCAVPLEKKPGQMGCPPAYCSKDCKADCRKAAVRQTRPCPICGDLFWGAGRKTCSVVCYRRTIGIPDERCRWCGVEFEPRNRTDRNCSPDCAERFRSEFIRTKVQPLGGSGYRIQPKQCMGCAVEFTPKDSTYATFCTRECAWANRWMFLPGAHTELWCAVSWAQCSQCSRLFVVRGKRTECGSECKRTADKKRACQRTRDWHLARGEPVSNPNPVCDHCGTRFSYNGMGRTPRFCGRVCAKTDMSRRPAVRLARHVYKRLRKMKVKVSRERIDPMVLFERDGWTCGICHRKIDKTIGSHQLMSPTVDHIVPFAKGGTHTWLNVQAAHLICNSKKGDRGSGQPRLL